MSYNPRQDDVYRQLQNLLQAIKMDTFNLTRDDQCLLEVKLDEFRRLLDEKYDK